MLLRGARVVAGPDQEKAAAAWVKLVQDADSDNPAGLLEQQSYLFDECFLDDDGDSNRCQDLQEALDGFQAAQGIGGRVVPMPEGFSADSDSASDNGPPPPDGFEWGITL